MSLRIRERYMAPKLRKVGLCAWPGCEVRWVVGMRIRARKRCPEHARSWKLEYQLNAYRTKVDRSVRFARATTSELVDLVEYPRYFSAVGFADSTGRVRAAPPAE